MATKTFYADSASAVTPDWFGLLTETSQAAATSGSTASVGKLAIGSFAKCQVFGTSGGGNANVNSASSLIDSTTGPTVGTSNTGTLIGDSVRTPSTLNGSFASGTWTIAFGMRPNTVQMQGRIRMRVWRSANVDGSSATEITSGAILGSVAGPMSSTTTTYTSTITWSAPAITLSGEYLFFQYEFQEQTSAGTSNTGKFNMRSGTESTIVTTNFTAASVAPFTPYRTKHRIRR